jgi:hypothetical protein
VRSVSISHPLARFGWGSTPSWHRGTLVICWLSSSLSVSNTIDQLLISAITLDEKISMLRSACSRAGFGARI